MRYVPAVAVTAALVLTAGVAVAAKKHHLRDARHPYAGVVVPGTDSGFAPPHMVEARPGVFISSHGCIQDEGYGRWTVCGQGRR